ncbi:Transcriptional regulator RPN4 [Candida viswanathii]|uniref:Transcriptional regulator RPN4 n=1 Tax=Candida viswanathii TaxID=5486 RepID=A0A367Y4L0_9ASCO|nr:Transcriptional regulator RPN4 [Candida viswanathii]
MTSLAILPQLKRTITDIMDEELYQSPSSPSVNTTTTANNNTHNTFNQFNNPNTPTNNNTFYNNNTTANQPMNYNYNSSRNSINSSPNLTTTTANLAQPTTNYNLGNVLNIPDSFLEQLASQEYIDHLKSQQQQQQQVVFDSDDMFALDFTSQQPQQVNPFNDYGNPNSFIRPLQQQQQAQEQAQQQQQQQQHTQDANAPLPQTFPTRRRRRITLLNEAIDGTSSNKKKHFDEEYILYNPDISPGQIVNQNELDSSLIIPPNSNDLFLSEQDQANAFANNDLIIPGYENDYLFLDDDDEQIEEDVSDDEGDNYFQVDEDFDDFMMNNSNYEDFSNFDTYTNNTTPTSTTTANNDTVKIEEQQQQPEEFAQPREVSPSAISSQDNDDMMVDVDDEVSTPQQEVSAVQQLKHTPKKSGGKEGAGKTKKHHSSHSISGAEITANNPNHQCNLINPSTGEPCNKQFSRPYDLIRHQDTIHATMKKIFRCVICEDRLNGGPGNGKDKTFSRGDALSRHIKIKHGLVGQDALDLINEAKANVEYVPV